MASVTALRNAMAARLATIDGLHAYARVPKEVNVPAAVVLPQPGAAIEFDATMGRGSDDFVFLVTVVITDVIDDLGQAQLDPYLDGSGAQSVKQVLEADNSLGGTAHHVHVAGVVDYGEITYAGRPYVGAEFLVRVTASGVTA